jgi:hypothetical protein
LEVITVMQWLLLQPAHGPLKRGAAHFSCHAPLLCVSQEDPQPDMMQVTEVVVDLDLELMLAGLPQYYKEASLISSGTWIMDNIHKSLSACGLLL